MHAKLVQGSLQALVDHGTETRYVAQRTWLTIFLDTSNARSAKAVSAAVREVRLAKDQETDGALTLNFFRRFDKVTLIPCFLFGIFAFIMTCHLGAYSYGRNPQL